MKDIGKVTVLQPKVRIDGTCSDRFAPVREAFAHNLETGQDVGASVAVYVDGENRSSTIVRAAYQALGA